MTDFVITKLADIAAALRPQSEATDLGGAALEVLNGSEFRKALETSQLQMKKSSEKFVPTGDKKSTEKPSLEKQEEVVKSRETFKDQPPRDRVENDVKNPHAVREANTREEAGYDDASDEKISLVVEESIKNQEDMSSPLENDITTATCFVDLLSPQTIIAMQSVFQETEGVPYVIVDNASTEDTRVSDLLTGDTRSAQRVASSEQVTTRIKGPVASYAKPISTEHFTYPEMTAEDFAEELMMIESENSTDHNPRSVRALDQEAKPVLAAHEAEALHRSNNTEHSPKPEVLSIASARNLAKAQATVRTAHVIKLPSPQNFKAEVFQQFRIGMMENLLAKKTDFHIDLHPKSLGHISVQIQFGEKHLHAQLAAANPDTRALLANNPDMVYRIVEEAAGLTNMMSFTFNMNQGNDSSHDGTRDNTHDYTDDPSVTRPLQWIARDRLLDTEI